jgi:AcrR family transcriptional regulator
VTRVLRADAERNRLRVLKAAREVFAAEGLEVPIDAIARRAGVGVGTLYRHFPTKEALFEAIVVGRMEELVADARARGKEADAGEAFFGYLARMVEEASYKKDFIAALATTSGALERIAECKAHMKRAVSVLLARAQDAGAVRRDVGVVEVMTLVMAALGASDRKRVLAVVLDGLRAR